MRLSVPAGQKTISASLVSAYRRGEKDLINMLTGGDDVENEHLDFGKRIHDMCSGQIDPKTESEKKLHEKFTEFCLKEDMNKHETGMAHYIPLGDTDWDVYGVLDLRNIEFTKIADIKTFGMRAGEESIDESIKRVSRDAEFQKNFYCCFCYKKYGVLVDKFFLLPVPKTRDEDGKLDVTGDLEVVEMKCPNEKEIEIFYADLLPDVANIIYIAKTVWVQDTSFINLDKK